MPCPLWRAGRDSNPRPSGSKTDPSTRSDAGLRWAAMHIAAQGGSWRRAVRLRRSDPALSGSEIAVVEWAREVADSPWMIRDVCFYYAPWPLTGDDR